MYIRGVCVYIGQNRRGRGGAVQGPSPGGRGRAVAGAGGGGGRGDSAGGVSV